MKTRALVSVAAVALGLSLAIGCTGSIVDHPVGGDDSMVPDAMPNAAIDGAVDGAVGPADAHVPLPDGAIIPPAPDATPGPSHDVTPRLIPGGGVADAPIGGELNVYAVDARTGAPIAGAQVRLGDAATASPLTGTTDATGLAVLTSVTLAGAQTVTVSAAGHAAATWIGVGGANVTLLLSPAAAPPSATVNGTISGWSSLPAPPTFNDYNLALVLYTFLDDLNAPENSIAQGTTSGTPNNVCLRTALSDSCAWKLNTRTGQQLHYAVIVRGNTHGTTNDQSDDTYTLLGFATGAAVTMSAGQTMAGESLGMISAGAMTGMQVSFASAPAGLTDVIAIPMLNLGALGRVMLPLPTVTPAATSAMLPSGGVLAGATTEVVAMATPPGSASQPFSLAFARHVSGTSASPGAFPAPPTAISAGGNHYAFTPMAGASMHVAAITASGGQVVYWSIVILDATQAFNLPVLATDPLPTGTLELHVTGTQDDGFTATDFAMPTVTKSFTHAAGDQVTFSH